MVLSSQAQTRTTGRPVNRASKRALATHGGKSSTGTKKLAMGIIVSSISSPHRPNRQLFRAAWRGHKLGELWHTATRCESYRAGHWLISDNRGCKNSITTRL